MGSKTKYYTNLDCQRMFDDDDDLYIEEMLRIYARTKSMDPADILPPMIMDSMFFFNERVFEKMGMAAEVEMDIIDITNDSVKSYIYTEVDPTVRDVLEWFTIDQNEKVVDSNLLKVKSYLEETYETCPGTPVETWQYLDGERSPEGQYIVETHPVNIDGVCYTIKTRDSGSDRLPDIVSMDPDGIGVDTPHIVLISMDDGTEYYEPYPDDTRVVYAIPYVQNNDDTKFIYAFQSDIKGQAEKDMVLMIPMKKNEQWVGDTDKYKKFVLNKFGLGAEDPKTGDSLEESLDQENLHDAFISYTVSHDDEDFGWIVKEVYGDIAAGLGREITVRSDEYSMSYVPTMWCALYDHDDPEGCEWIDKCYDKNNPPDCPDSLGCCNAYRVVYGREEVFLPKHSSDENGETKEFSPMFLVPIRFLKRQGVPMKFRAYKKLFTMWIYMEKKVKIKWYQTSFFRFLFLFAAMIFTAIFFGPAGLFKMVIGQIIGIASQALDPRIAGILSIVIGFVMGSFQGIQGVMNAIQQALKIINSFHLMAFRADLEQIQNDTKNYSKETREMAKWISEVRKRAIWAPLDWTNDAYNMPFRLLYEMPYTDMYNYDNMFERQYAYYPH